MATINSPNLRGVVVHKWQDGYTSSVFDDTLHLRIPAAKAPEGDYPLDFNTLALLIAKQRAVRERARQRRLHAAKIAAFTCKRAVKVLQRHARPWINGRLVECPICYDELPWRETKRMCKSKAPAAHRLCGGCARQYVDISLGEGKLYVRCPGVGCQSIFSTPEIKTLASPEALARYEDNLLVSHAQRLADETDPEFLAFCSTHARRCPKCQVVIFRYAGCDHMACRCGHNFSWSAPEAQIALSETPA